MKTTSKQDKKTRKLLQDLKGFITKNYGKRCKKFDHFCAVCIMWQSFDVIKEGAELAV